MVRGDRGNSRDSGSIGLNRYSQKDYSGEEYNSSSKGVRGGGCDDFFSGSCGIDGNQWSGDGRDSHVGWCGCDRMQQGRRSHSSSGSIRIQRNTS